MTGILRKSWIMGPAADPGVRAEVRPMARPDMHPGARPEMHPATDSPEGMVPEKAERAALNAGDPTVANQGKSLEKQCGIWSPVSARKSKQSSKGGCPVLVIGIVFLLLVVVFAVQNAQVVPITFLSWGLNISLALVVLGSASLGVIVGAVWAWFRGIPARGKAKDLARELQQQIEARQNAERAVQDMLQSKENHEPTEDKIAR